MLTRSVKAYTKSSATWITFKAAIAYFTGKRPMLSKRRWETAGGQEKRKSSIWLSWLCEFIDRYNGWSGADSVIALE